MTRTRRTSRDAAERKRRAPFLVRLTARAALISLMVAVLSLGLASAWGSLGEPGFVTLGLKLLFYAAAATSATALVCWSLVSGLHFVFRPEEPKDDGPPNLF